jgi:hypothetical protein
MWKHYHVRIRHNRKNFLIVIEATSAIDAQRIAVADWGADRVLEVRSSGR